MLKKIINILCSIPLDKMLHFIVGLMVVALTAIIFPRVARYAVVLSIFAGIFKEAIDEFDYGGWDWKDLAATAAGGLLMQIIIWVLC